MDYTKELNMKKMLFAVGCLFTVSYSYAGSGAQAIAIPSTVNVSSAPAASNAVATVTLSTPSLQGQGSYSAGYTDYITHIRIEAAYTGGVASNSTPTNCTTTNVSGNPTWFIPPAITTGTLYVADIQYANPLVAINSSSNTVVNCPATANVRWNVNVNHYVAP